MVLPTAMSSASRPGVSEVWGACCPVCTDMCADMACKQACDEHKAHLISRTLFHYTWLWDTLKMRYLLWTGTPYLPSHPASSQESAAWGLSPYLGMVMCTTVIIQVSEELVFHDLKKLWGWAFYITYTLSKIDPKLAHVASCSCWCTTLSW